MADFATLRRKVKLEDVAEWLGFELKRHGETLRGPCLICQSTSDRCFVITPAKQLWNCFADCRDHHEKTGGDHVFLVSKLKRVSLREAGKLIAAHFLGKPAVKESKLPPGGLPYLQFDHETVKALGLTPDQAAAHGIGYAPKGTLSGRLLIPIRNERGVLVGYIGFAPNKNPPLKLGALAPP